MAGRQTVPPSTTLSQPVREIDNIQVRAHSLVMRKPYDADCRLDTPDPSASRPRQDAEAPVDGAEEGEEMDVANDDDAAMMAMMGMGGFGSTKVRTLSHVFSPHPRGVDI